MLLFHKYSHKKITPLLTLNRLDNKKFSDDEQKLLNDVKVDIKTYMNQFPDFPRKESLTKGSYLWSTSTVFMDPKHVETWKRFTVLNVAKLTAQWVIDDLFDTKCKPGDVPTDVMDYISMQFSTEHGDPMELPSHLEEMEVAAEILRTVSRDLSELGGCPDLWKLCVSDFKRWVLSYVEKINFKGNPPRDFPTYYANRWVSIGVSGCIFHTLYLQSVHYNVREATDLLIGAGVVDMDMPTDGDCIQEMWFLSAIVCADYNDIVSQKEDVEFGVPSLCNLKDQLEDRNVFHQLEKNVEKLLICVDKFPRLTRVVMETVLGNAFFHMAAKHRYDTAKYVEQHRTNGFFTAYVIGHACDPTKFFTTDEMELHEQFTYYSELIEKRLKEGRGDADYLKWLNEKYVVPLLTDQGAIEAWLQKARVQEELEGYN